MAFSLPTPRDLIKPTDALRKWITDIFSDLNDGHYLVDVQEETAANIADIDADINTTGKYAGKRVWDTTNKRELRASGGDADDDWEVVDGSAQVTPT